MRSRVTPDPSERCGSCGWKMRQQIDREIRADVEMLHHLADYDASIDGLKLSRFDKVMGLTRPSRRSTAATHERRFS